MKKLLLIAVGMLATLSAYAQGTVNFANVAGPATARTVNAPVFHTDGTTRLSGPGFQAQLYAGPSASALTAVGNPAPFLTGAGAGYFQGGSRTIPTVAPGAAATVVVRAWDTATGATWEAAGIKGESGAITVTTGGAGTPPSLPANLVGLQSFSLVPEPSTIALAILGVAALFVRRRK